MGYRAVRLESRAHLLLERIAYGIDPTGLQTFHGVTMSQWGWHSMPCPVPGDGADPAVVAATIDKVWTDWKWDHCWGWDFPMMAMAAARNGRPGMAVDALLHASGKNAYNRVGLSTGGPFPYFPSNGGLLYAVALMAAGWDGAPTGVQAPGFSQDGSWKVKWEGLAPAP